MNGALPLPRQTGALMWSQLLLSIGKKARAMAKKKASNKQSSQSQEAGDVAELESEGGELESGAADDADEAEDEESEEDEEDLDPELEALLSFAQMDSEAAAAYEIAAESATEERLAEMMRSFAEDHRRHVADIEKLVTELGGEIEFAAPDPEASTFASMAETVSQLGPEGGLLALIASEQFTNSSYESALELIVVPEARALVERHFRDEQRHLQALTQELKRSAQAEERETE